MVFGCYFFAQPKFSSPEDVAIYRRQGGGGDLTLNVGYPLFNYFANSGKMIITGQDIGYLDDYYYHKYGVSFLPDLFFEAYYVADKLTIGGVTATRAYGDADYSTFLSGRQYDFAAGGDGANNQTSPDEIRATLYTDMDAYPILTSQDSTLAKPRHLGTRISWEPTIERAKKTRPSTMVDYRNIYLSFGLEGVNNNAGGVTGTRDELLDRLLAWLDDKVTVKFGSSSYSGMPNASVSFQAEAGVSITQTKKGYANSITKYRWDYGDGSAVATTTAPSTSHTYAAAGSYTAYVEAMDTFGHTAVSQATVTIGSLIPGAATQVSPSGTITTTTPTYIWNALAGSTHYYLWVNDSTGDKIKNWYSAAEANCASGMGTCSVTPATSLATGNGQWWIQTYNDSGYGPWSSGMSFNLTLAGVSPLYPLSLQRKAEN